MPKLFDVFRTVFMPVSEEEERPKYVHGEPVAGAKHYLVEEHRNRQRRPQSFVFPHGRDKPWL
jgi:hypothetical protein